MCSRRWVRPYIFSQILRLQSPIWCRNISLWVESKKIKDCWRLWRAPSLHSKTNSRDLLEDKFCILRWARHSWWWRCRYASDFSWQVPSLQSCWLTTYTTQMHEGYTMPHGTVNRPRQKVMPLSQMLSMYWMTRDQTGWTIYSCQIGDAWVEAYWYTSKHSGQTKIGGTQYLSCVTHFVGATDLCIVVPHSSAAICSGTKKWARPKTNSSLPKDSSRTRNLCKERKEVRCRSFSSNWSE